MALDTNATKLDNLINPQVLAPMIEQKMADAMKFTPLATVDNTLQGRAGNTVSLPKFSFIGVAEEVAEGADIPIKQLTSTKVEVTVKKAGIGTTITDEAILSGYGDPQGEMAKQIGLSIGTKVDNDLLAALNGVQVAMTYTATGKLTSADVANALVKFGEDIDGDKVLLIAPEQLAQLRTTEAWVNTTDMGVAVLMSGVVGSLWGCQVAVSNKIKKTGDKYTNFIVKPGALALFMKRDTLVEADRDITNKTNVVTADKHYVAYLYDDTKAIKIVTTEA